MKDFQFQNFADIPAVSALDIDLAEGRGNDNLPKLVKET
jgi:hypothetical protein